MTSRAFSISRIRLVVAAIVSVLLVVAVVVLGCSDDSRAANPEASTFQPSATSTSSPTAVSGAANSPAAASTPTERRASLTPLGHLNPGADGFHGDIWAHKGFAYMGTWGSGNACPASGVKVIDLTDPTNPQWVSTVAAIPGTSQEDIVVRSIRTPAFTGDLLAVGIQSCTFTTPGGLALFDVTDPRRPVDLGFLASGARGVHELDLIQQGDRALALLAVPYSETSPGRGGDFRIVDVSNPRRPVQVSEWGAGAGLNLDLTGGIGCRHSIYGHSARASGDGKTAYLSYWDAGVIALDISDPARPRVIGHLTYQPQEAGTTHSVAEAANGRLLLIADEEVVFGTPPGLSLEVQTPAGPRSIHGCEARFSAPIDTVGPIEAGLVDAGRACANDAMAANVRGQVAIAHEGGCQPGDKAARLASAGARAVIVGVPGEAVSEIGGGRASIPVIIVSEQDALALRDITSDPAARVTLPSARPWGGLRIWDISDMSKARQVAIYQTPNSLRFPAPDDGYYTVHNAEVIDDLVVASWWTDGVRVIDISNPSAPRELTSYVPPAEPNPQRVIFPDRTMVWGVAVAGDLILLSDVNSGLHVLRLDRG